MRFCIFASFLIAVLAFSPTPAHAEGMKDMYQKRAGAGMGMVKDNKDVIAIYGHGNARCSDFLEAMDKNQTAIVKNYQVWLNGFLSAYNTLVSANGNVANGKKMDDMMGWVGKQCRSYPSSYFQRATIELLRALEAGDF
ncbi:MAG: hypothetical protein AB7G80_04405 [Dongiaceae bacterium]